MLVLSLAGGMPAQEIRQLAAQDQLPDKIVADAYGAEELDDLDLAGVGGMRGRLLRALPASAAVALEAWWRRREYEVMLTWGESTAFPLALMLALTPRRRTSHIAVLMWPFNESNPSRARRLLKRVAFRLLALHGIDRFCLPSPRQRELAIERWGISPHSVLPVLWPIDTDFWRPMEGAGDMILSAGVEMRDYPTLLRALEGLPIPCHIAAGKGFLRPDSTAVDADLARLDEESLPANVTVGPRSPLEMRELYARSRIVVVPILRSQSDNGVTVVAEAMAMERPVISTATEGHAEILKDGEDCVLVAPGDVEGLRAAILALWEDHERCARLGAAGRELVVPAHGLVQWVSGVRAAAAELAGSRRAPAAPPDSR